jgi:hypothetical protein
VDTRELALRGTAPVEHHSDQHRILIGRLYQPSPGDQTILKLPELLQRAQMIYLHALLFSTPFEIVFRQMMYSRSLDRDWKTAH